MCDCFIVFFAWDISQGNEWMRLSKYINHWILGGGSSKKREKNENIYNIFRHKFDVKW
jgi:hypothetical protein